MAQGDLSGIQVLCQTGELPLHPYPVDESGFRGVHQRVRKSSRRCQPLSYRFIQILDGQGKRCNDEYLRFHHVVQFRRQRPHDGLFSHQLLPDTWNRKLQTAVQGGTAQTRQQRQTGGIQASGRSGTQGNAPGIGQSAFRLHRKPEVCRGNNSGGRLFRLTGRTLFLAEGIFKRKNGPKTHRQTGGSRNKVRTHRL